MAETKLILASQSAIRAHILTQAGVPFTVQPPQIDETALHKQLAPDVDLAQKLAAHKALEVSRRFPKSWVLGCDQILMCEGTLLHKAATKAEATQKLAHLRGKTHNLYGHSVLARGGQIDWEHDAHATLTMRPFSDAFLDYYLKKAPDTILTSVGAYQYEGLGIQLFSAIEGDMFTILGLTLLPLLEALRQRSILRT